MPGKPRNWKDWLERNPLKIVCGVVVAACTVTVGVMNYFSGEEMKIEEKSAAAKLDQTKQELSTRLHDLETRLVSIERRVGTEAMLDVSILTVTPKQIKGLGASFVYNDGIRAYLSLPDLSSWKFVETTELGLLAMISNVTEESAESTSGVMGQFSKEFKVSLWRAPESFPVANSDSDVAFNLFPYVAVEVIDNEKMFRLMGKVPEMVEKLEGIKPLENALDSFKDSEPGTDNKNKEGETPASTPGDAAETVAKKLSEIYNSDTAGLFLSSSILQGFIMSMQVPGARFRVLDAEKKGNVLYMHTQTVFHGTSKKKVGPSKSLGQTVYWDREIICIGRNDSTYVVSTSAPSLDQRPSAGPWITEWLAGLRVPLE
jgi:hypothetical protein